MQVNTILKNGIFLSLCILFITKPAYAYLDPGTGSAILQGVLGAVAAIAVILKLYWYRILRFLGLSKKRSALEQKVKGGAREN
jgi:hypothetical protein